MATPSFGVSGSIAQPLIQSARASSITPKGYLETKIWDSRSFLVSNFFQFDLPQIKCYGVVQLTPFSVNVCHCVNVPKSSTKDTERDVESVVALNTQQLVDNLVFFVGNTAGYIHFVHDDGHIHWLVWFVFVIYPTTRPLKKANHNAYFLIVLERR